ncbi:MAG: ParB/RepB/Spo0J family partition protein [Actinomycetia bacterium]|nr:ParB/RepB/Spo0J family partition protein [Actinomycetes bacterium]MCH9800513.1 ParB/RepB/Spo0J family partition protein [Actinomycetes bacterium]
MTQRRGLGRGLGALIPTAPENSQDLPQDSPQVIDLREPSPGSELAASVATAYREVPLDTISPNPRQPRQVFDEEALSELVHSINTIGLLQPIVVRPATGGYELIAGERRLRASKLAGLESIPVFVRETEDDALLRDALLENLHRSSLNALEEAAAYDQLLKDFSCTQEQLAERIGRSRSQIANTLRLLKLPPKVQRRVAAGVLSAGHARALLAADSEQEMETLATRIVAEGLSVRAVEELVMVGESGGRRRRAATPRQIPVEYEAAADRIADRLETRVRVESGKTKGRIIVEFAAVDDLARIVDIIEGSESQPS